MRARLRRPASLRGRVVLGVLALLAVLLVGLFVAVDLILGARLRSDLRTRLEDRVALAEQLDGAMSPQDLVDRLKGDGVTVSLCTSASSSSSSSPQCVSPHVTPAPAGGPPAGGRFGTGAFGSGSGNPPARRPVSPAPTTTAPIEQDGALLYVHTTLPRSGQQLSLAVDTTQINTLIGRLILLEVIGGLLALLVAALLLGRVVALALRPLDQMTGLARQIAGGDRGRRLRTGRPDTELGRTATAFDAMLDELEAALAGAAAAQDQLRGFLSDASHELRSPLAGLQATSELLLRNEPDAVGRERAYLAMIRETRRASRLVDDLLTVTRLDTGAPLAVEPVDLVEVVRHEVQRCALLAPLLDVRIDGVAQANVDGDPIRLGQIVANVLDNARHATGGRGAVHVHLAQDGRGWHLDIVDSGPGIPAADAERIFARLARLDDSRDRHTGGFGLGLPIARGLARAHGGELICVPRQGGARFRLMLPLAVRQPVTSPA